MKNILVIIIGGLAGYYLVSEFSYVFFPISLSISLKLLILSVGLGIGFKFKAMKSFLKGDLLMLYIPIGTVIGSLIGGAIAAFSLDFPINLSLAIASGFGWSSLSATILTESHGVEIGAIAFLTNIFRWAIGIISIPYIAKFINYYTAIAIPAATSMDASLQVISSNTDVETVMVSVVNGMILTILVPIMVPLFLIYK